jgi:hypothetical protein
MQVQHALEQVVAYESRKLKQHEVNYALHDLE